MLFFKKFFKGTLFFVLAGTAVPANALVVYGVSNDDAKVDYDSSAHDCLSSVVKVGTNSWEGSAVYLGNGWFITANHVVTTAGTMSVYQNGTSATITSVSSCFGPDVDLKMFYCEDLSGMTYLKTATLLTDPWPEIKQSVIYSSSDPNVMAFVPGTILILAGSGYGRSESELDASYVKSKDVGGDIHYGLAEVYYNSTGDGIYWTCARELTGSAQATSGDSGGAAFVRIDGEDYLLGIMTNVGFFNLPAEGSASATDIYFGEDGELTNVYLGSEITQAYVGDFSQTMSATKIVGLENYVSTIMSVVAVPEPSLFGVFAGIFALVFAGTRRRRGKR